ncbi:MAG: FG-GAP repeat protein, partial [Ardenticatenaceae bacterium]
DLGYGLAISGDTIVAGADNDVGANGHQGTVYVSVKPATGWVSSAENARLIASDGRRDDLLGGSVTIEGETVVAGAAFADPGGNRGQGTAYVFEKPPAGWTGVLTETAKLLASDGAAEHFFGEDVALEGPTLVMGAYGYTNTPGAAYIFEEPLTGWSGTLTETAKLTPSDGHPDDTFGRAIALHDETVVVGAYSLNIGDAYKAGAVYVFEEPVGGWSGTLSESQQLLSPNPTDNGFFGARLALAGNTLVIGEPTLDEPGRAYVFEDDTPQPRLDLAYTYYTSGGSGSGIFHLLDDGTFSTDASESGAWTYQPGPQRFLLQFDAGHFCAAFFVGRVQGGNAVRGFYACQDGSGVGGVWEGSLSLPLAALPAVPVGDLSLAAP